MAIDIGLIEKIRALRNLFKGKDVDPLAIKQISDWEKRIQELSVTSDFVQHPVTQEVKKKFKDRLKKIMLERATGQGHTSESLKYLDARENELRYALALFMPAFEAELSSLEQLVDNELVGLH